MWRKPSLYQGSRCWAGYAGRTSVSAQSDRGRCSVRAQSESYGVAFDQSKFLCVDSITTIQSGNFQMVCSCQISVIEVDVKSLRELSRNFPLVIDTCTTSKLSRCSGSLWAALAFASRSWRIYSEERDQPSAFVRSGTLKLRHCRWWSFGQVVEAKYECLLLVQNGNTLLHDLFIHA